MRKKLPEEICLKHLPLLRALSYKKDRNGDVFSFAQEEFLRCWRNRKKNPNYLVYTILAIKNFQMKPNLYNQITPEVDYSLERQLLFRKSIRNMSPLAVRASALAFDCRNITEVQNKLYAEGHSQREVRWAIKEVRDTLKEVENL